MAGPINSTGGDMPKRYRKMPVEIEAGLLKAENAFDVADWCNGKVVFDPNSEPFGVEITTLEGTMRADIGDYVICGVKGEFYPCKPDIFTATYELVE